MRLNETEVFKNRKSLDDKDGEELAESGRKILKQEQKWRKKNLKHRNWEKSAQYESKIWRGTEIMYFSILWSERKNFSISYK